MVSGRGGGMVLAFGVVVMMRTTVGAQPVEPAAGPHEIDGKQSDLPGTLAKPVDDDPSHPTAAMSIPHKVALVFGGAAVLGAGIGLWTGIDARGLRNEAREMGCTDDLTRCPPEALLTANRAYTRSGVATGFVVASVGLALVGAVLWATAANTDARAGEEDASAWRFTPAIGTEDLTVRVGRSF